MTTHEEIQSLLTQHGAVLVRADKHPVYRFPDGQTFVTASTPSDHRASLNALATLRSLLGIGRDVRKNPNRRKKTPPRPAAYRSTEPPGFKVHWKDQLMIGGMRNL